jgi:hypothetical protein
MKKFGLPIPKGFHKKPKDQLVKIRKSSWDESRKKKHSERMSGDNNPFYGKTHTDSTREQMSKNHADFTGDKNPLKNACIKNPDILKKLSENKLEYWSNKTTSERYNLNKKNICGDISKGHWTNIINNAKSRNKVFDISPEYAWSVFLEQEEKCALTGVRLNLKSIYDITASLDRINNDLGYIEGNIQWLHKQINIMKNVYLNQDFIDIAYLIVEKNIKDESDTEAIC